MGKVKKVRLIVDSDSDDDVALEATDLTFIEQEYDKFQRFEDMGLDERLLEYGIKANNWTLPKIIQDQSIKHILEGTNLLLNSGPATGKTTTYVIAIINQLLKKPKDELNTFALVLAATKEMCSKAHKIFSKLSEFAYNEFLFLDMNDSTFNQQKRLLGFKPHVIISTPTLILEHLKVGNVNLKETLEFVVVDEIDLLLESNYGDQLKALVNYLPPKVQLIFFTKLVTSQISGIYKLFNDIPPTGSKTDESDEIIEIIEVIDVEEDIENVSPLKKKLRMKDDEIPKKLTKVNKREKPKKDLSLSKVTVNKCEFCNKEFVNSSNLARHMRSHTGEKSFQCQYCDKTFAQSSNKIDHERAHTGEKPFQCQEENCDSAFKTSHGKTVHERTHTGEKPFQCQYCDKTFAQSGSKIIHERTHTGEKAFECKEENCDATFKTSTHLKEHEKIHTDEKPFECDECDKKFTTSSKLKSHAKIHTDEKPFQCEICEFKCTQASYLKEHVKRIHA